MEIDNDDDDVFKLLKLPSVALQQIIGGVASKDLYELVQCSDKTMRTCHFFERSNRVFKMAVDFTRHWVEIRGVQKYYVKEMKDGDSFVESKEFDGEVVPIVEDKDVNTFDTFWPAGQEMYATKKIAQHFVNYLGIGTLDQIFLDERDPALEILDWADQQKLVMDNFHLTATSPEQTMALAERVFSNEFMDKVKKIFTSLMEVPEDFTPTRYSTDKGVYFDKIHLDFSHWFTIEHLMSMHTQSIVLYRCTLTAADLNKYLAAWRDGEHRELSFVSFHLKTPIKLHDVLKGLVDPPAIDKNDDDMRDTAILVRRSDGQTMQIELEDDYKNFVASIN